MSSYYEESPPNLMREIGVLSRVFSSFITNGQSECLIVGLKGKVPLVAYTDFLCGDVESKVSIVKLITNSHLSCDASSSRVSDLLYSDKNNGVNEDPSLFVDYLEKKLGITFMLCIYDYFDMLDELNESGWKEVGGDASKCMSSLRNDDVCLYARPEERNCVKRFCASASGYATVSGVKRCWLYFSPKAWLSLLSKRITSYHLNEYLTSPASRTPVCVSSSTELNGLVSDASFAANAVVCFSTFVVSCLSEVFKRSDEHLNPTFRVRVRGALQHRWGRSVTLIFL